MVKRFVYTEWEDIRQLTAYLSILAYIKDDLKERLKEINGEEKIDYLLQETKSLLNGLLETMPDSQHRKLKNTIKDCKPVLVPKLSTYSTNVLLTKEEATTLVDFAQEKCTMCLGEEADIKHCKLYKVLESAVPLDSTESIACPYSRAEWR